MILNPPAGQTVQIAAPVAISSGIAARPEFDMVAKTVTVYYGINPQQGEKSVTVNIPAALLTALENGMQKVIEANEGWTAGSSTVVST
jgi:hypothetical protein